MGHQLVLQHQFRDVIIAEAGWVLRSSACAVSIHALVISAAAAKPTIIPARSSVSLRLEGWLNTFHEFVEKRNTECGIAVLRTVNHTVLDEPISGRAQL